MKNQVQLITYVDRLGGGGLPELAALLRGPLANLFGGVHLLPFFHRIDGADAGFDPIDHTQVDARLGDWSDVQTLAEQIEVMADVIVNHVSSESPQFQDWLQHGSASRYDGLFLTREQVFPDGVDEAAMRALYRPRPGVPFTVMKLGSGEERTLWTTFTPQQIDIDVEHPRGREYLDSILQRFRESGIHMLRLDAVGYAIKTAGTSCFMTPQTFDFVEAFSRQVRSLGMEVLVEIHSHYRQQIDVAKRVDRVYDFALPPLVLHAFAFRTAKYLHRWISIRPHNAMTVLDTHDGIGIIDIGPERSDPVIHPGLVPADELDQLVDMIHANSRETSRLATGGAASNLDLYQINCTFYDALAQHDVHYLLARAIQFFLPGIPQVYYVGLLAGRNDVELLKRTQVGRDINRHYFSAPEIATALERPVVRKLCELIQLRNTHPAFNGGFSSDGSDHQLRLHWQNNQHFAELSIDFTSDDYALRYSCDAGEQHWRAESLV